MEGKNSGLFDWLVSKLPVDENTHIVYEPNNNTVFQSKLQDDNGNINLFKLIYDKNAPDFVQRIITDDNRNYN